MSFGERLKQARVDVKMSAPKLGELIGRTRQYIYQLEAGSRGVEQSPEIVGVLESALGLPSGELAQHLPASHPARLITEAGVRVLGLAGAGPDIDVPFEEEILRLGPEFAGCVSYRVRGDSMIGSLIANGDYVLFRPTEESQPEPGDVVIAWIASGQGGHVVKKLGKQGQLFSDGSERWTHKMRDGDRIIGSVRGVIRKI